MISFTPLKKLTDIPLDKICLIKTRNGYCLTSTPDSVYFCNEYYDGYDQFESEEDQLEDWLGFAVIE